MSNTRLKHKGLALAAAAALATVGSATAAITIDFEAGGFLQSTGDYVPLGSLVATIVDTNGDGLIGGVLGKDSSLTSADALAIYTAFAGQTIAAGNTIGGDLILLTVATDNVGSPTNGTTNQGYLGANVSNVNISGLEEGALLGVFWFPELTLGSATLGDGNFQVGGINDTTSLVTFQDGDQMLLPADAEGDTLLLEIVPEWVYPELGGFSNDRLTAVSVGSFAAVPEPSAALLAFAGLALPVLRRRRH